MYRALAPQVRRLPLPLAFTAILALITILTGPRAERLGDRFQIALPILALACSAVNGNAPEYLLRYGVMFTGLHSAKIGFGDAPFNQRPNGGDRGMPSGHTATAVFGASTLLHECGMNSLPARTAVLLAAAFTGASRMDAGAHTIWQVLCGALWGLGCDRALRHHAPSRRRIRTRLALFGRFMIVQTRKLLCFVPLSRRLRLP